jgi:NADH-quinone oxidoreductase subunit L
MNYMLLYFALFPLLACLLSLILPRRESFISQYALFAIVSHTIIAQVFTALWLFGSESQIFYQGPAIYSSGGIEFILSFVFDKITAVYSLVGSLLTSLIVVYSRIYLHRENGYKRFFTTILLFYAGFNIIIFSGNFEILFMGWEILGLSSFLLIAFYRDRYLPVKNAFKVFSIYRLGDIGLILTTWLCHLIWHKNIQFYDLSFISEASHMADKNWLYLFLTLSILLSAAAKSAQFPFCSWMPRAMEGPTPSSAIFYGSLSVHIGAFILLRTFPLWEGQTPGRIFIGSIGLLTAFLCNGSARVQSTIKSQVAYSSLTQIGLIFVEISLGFDNLALFHFAGNAFLRTYQLLVSPSIVSYLIREQFYKPAFALEDVEVRYPRSWINTFYILSLKEWYLDVLLERFLWLPFKRAGSWTKQQFISKTVWLLVSLSLLAILFIEIGFIKEKLFLSISASLIAFVGFLFVLRSFVERQNPLFAWSLILANHIWILLAVGAYDALNSFEIIIYISGVFVSWFGGILCLNYLQKNEGPLTLDTLSGYSSKYSVLAFFFLLCCLGLSGFPITPTFIGEDIVFHHIHQEELLVALFIGLSYIFDGLCILRIYARLFMGPSTVLNNPVARRSS